MKKEKSEITKKLASWASGKTQIKRLVIFNVTNELESPPKRNPEIEIELLQGDPVSLSELWLNEIRTFFAANLAVLLPGKPIVLSKRSDYVLVYERISKKPATKNGGRPKRG